MLKSELLEKLKNIAEDADVNEAILSIDDFAKSSEIDITKLTIDDYKNMLANNEVIKAYYQSSFDSAVGSAVTKHDQKFMKEKFPTLLEEEIKKRDTSNLTPEQIQLKELQEQLDAMKAEKAETLRIEANRTKLKENKLDEGLAKYINSDEDLDYFKQLFYASVEQNLKDNSPKPEKSEGLNNVTDPFLKGLGF